MHCLRLTLLIGLAGHLLCLGCGAARVDPATGDEAPPQASSEATSLRSTEGSGSSPEPEATAPPQLDEAPAPPPAATPDIEPGRPPAGLPARWRACEVDQDCAVLAAQCCGRDPYYVHRRHLRAAERRFGPSCADQACLGVGIAFPNPACVERTCVGRPHR